MLCFEANSAAKILLMPGAMPVSETTNDPLDFALLLKILGSSKVNETSITSS